MRGLLHLCAICIIWLVSSGAGSAFELHNGTNADLITSDTLPSNDPALKRQPVLFVHGHGTDAMDAGARANYQQNWIDPIDFIGTTPDLSSFQRVIADPSNSGLNIEPYYIRFVDQGRAIGEDADDIAAAVDLIVKRHNPGFDPATENAAPPVKVVIIGYSKGTISSRLYLKRRADSVAPRPNYRPVSEFIAIAPPNHGLAAALFANTDKLSVKQLYNGVKPEGNVLINSVCGALFDPDEPLSHGFISSLNGQTTPTTDDRVDSSTPNANEAPGSRASGTAPHTGTLYIVLYSNSDEFVGTDRRPSTDCRGRGVSINLAPNAVNLLVGVSAGGLTSDGITTVHQRIVHSPDTICKALYAAAHQASPSGQTCPAFPTIPPPQPAVAMLTLDISGSMLNRDCPSCERRLDILKDSVELFTQLWAQLGRPQDRLGVTYFRTRIDQFANGDVLPLFDNADAIVADVRSQQSGRTLDFHTAMGGGLQRAIQALRMPVPAAAARRHIILFTDGMQNVNPMVRPDLSIDDEAGRLSSGETPTSPPIRLDMLNDISIDTIGIGSGEPFLGLLDDIASDAHGKFSAMTDPAELRKFFIEEVIEVLRGFSPQLIGYRRGTVGAGGATEAFQVESAARKLLLKASWPRGQSHDVRVFKDGVDRTASARVVADSFYRILVFDAPAAGEWQVRITGAAGTGYEAAAIVDTDALQYVPRFTPAPHRVDGRLELSVQLLAGKRPVDGNVSVSAEVKRPRQAVGNVLGDIKAADAKLPASEPGMTLAERRLAALATDKERQVRLQPAISTLKLEGDGKGGYRSALSNPTVPGLYRATLRIVGEDAKLGKFERSQTVSAIVRFDAAVLAKSAIAVATASKTALDFSLRPRDRHDNLLGPGLANAIKLAVTTGKIVTGPEDLGDGRYRFRLSFPSGKEPQLTVTVADRPLFKGTIKGLRAAARK